MRSSGFYIFVREELFGETVGADEEFFCADLGDLVGLEGDVILFFIVMVNCDVVDYFDSGGGGTLKERVHHFSGVDLSFRLVEDEVFCVLKAEFGNS